MGYRSEVTIIIQAQEDRTLIRRFLNGVVDEDLRKVHGLDKPTQEEEKWAMFLAEVAVKPETELAWREISSGLGDVYGNTLELDKEKRRITINFEGMKWYEGYEDVDSYMALFHSVKPYEDYIDAIYLRIGEDREDMEDEYYGLGYSLASIERSIEICSGN